MKKSGDKKNIIIILSAHENKYARLLRFICIEDVEQREIKGFPLFSSFDDFLIKCVRDKEARRLTGLVAKEETKKVP